MKKVFILGGAGFVGSHFAAYLANLENIEGITIYDNFSSTRAFYPKDNKKCKVVKGDIQDLNLLTESMKGHDIVIHLASNPDIARAVKEPSIDFDQGTFLTQNVLEAMRICGSARIIYASGSGIYGDTGSLDVKEDHGPLQPISTYGASKLAGEALISAYSFMFDITGLVFRFGNIVGPRQTHGIGFDFIRKLKADPNELHILGNGNQSKSYIYIDDVINAVLLAESKISDRFSAFNVATGDYITVREIAEIAIKKVVGNSKVKLVFADSDRGWKGDVPIVRLNTNKIRNLGWQCLNNSAQAIEKSIQEMLKEQDLVV